MLDAFVANAKDLGLPEDAHILTVVDGSVVGRTAKLVEFWVIIQQKMQRLFQSFAKRFITVRSNRLLKGTAVVGLDEDFHGEGAYHNA